MSKKGKNLDEGRRSFLKGLGLGFGTIAVASCDRTIEKAIPLLIQPEEVVPGEALHYATSYFNGLYFESVLAKVVDGRPIKIEPNELYPASYGTSVQAQASVLDLYDDARIKAPRVKNQEVSIQEINELVPKQLNVTKDNNQPIILLSHSIISQTTQQLINEFKEQFEIVDHLVFDSLSFSAIRKTNELNFGKAIIPVYRIDKANVIVSFQADFLTGFLNPTEFSKQYADWKEKKLNNKECIHYQFESAFSLTGTSADKRFVIKPSEEFEILQDLLQTLESNSIAKFGFNNELALQLKRNKGNSLVISGTNDLQIQLTVNKINHLLENFGSTIDFQNESFLFQGNEELFLNQVRKYSKVKGGVLINLETDVFFQYGYLSEIHNLFDNRDLSISFSYYEDETTENCDVVIPQSHYLESWNDFSPSSKFITFSQPAISKIFDSFQYQDVLLKWMGKRESYFERIKRKFLASSNLESLSDAEQQSKWFDALQNGFVENKNFKKEFFKFKDYIIPKNQNKNPIQGIEIQFVPDANFQIGNQPHNPWLSELPNPITKATWGQYALLGQELAKNLDVKTGEIIKIQNIEIPVIIQKGQELNTIILPLGFGRNIKNRKFEIGGKNIHSLLDKEISINSIEKLGKKVAIPFNQTQDSIENRELLHKSQVENEKQLYPAKEYFGHHWLMVIDLNKCTGCNSCVISCQAENNISVVGPDEVRKNRSMYWMNIHRYFEEKPEGIEMRVMPVMCQHCDSAPCENVCPVAATNHSKEGINQMAYNRCIGTRYCNNNCPYKVRVFNWFDYNGADSFFGNECDYAGMTSTLRRMVLNPDVTTRSKGVIEKCSFCFQRIQNGKNIAKNEGRKLKDEDVIPACASACPSNAITFGDRNDSESKVSKLLHDSRASYLLQELNTLPSVVYLQKNQLES